MSNVIEFYKQDFPSTLFPLNTNLILIENHSEEINKYVYEKILNSEMTEHSFLSQQKVYATKPKNHLRRTIKLDPIAEFFIYDVIYRNRTKFRGAVSEERKCFGYIFKDGEAIKVHEAYANFKSDLNSLKEEFSYYLKFDIASYFNSLYHHDVCHWFTSKGVSETDSIFFGQFFREINSGRSVDFMPHGIYPSKMIGNEFLKYIDLNHELKSSKIIRFMDDFILFDNDQNVLKKDFIKIQKLLGSKGLNINPAKTSLNSEYQEVSSTLSSVKQALMAVIPTDGLDDLVSGVEVNDQQQLEQAALALNATQIEQLLNLLKDNQIEEEDAELILSFLKDYSDNLLIVLPDILKKFPNLIKQVYSVSLRITDKELLANVLLEHLESEHLFLEYELFWLGKLVEDCLLDVSSIGKLLMKIYELSNNYKIAQAKILEIPVNNFGLKEIRLDYLKTGQSDWLAWSSAIGLRGLQAAERNYNLDYFSKASPINFLIASCVKKL
ncbi:MAG: RNA-directed DNA polymerase [Candidatus Acinetobacter avistercoris]|nr:RNA-directed DNA polymerase [Candidatus Acinetobacter avistercoris]